MIHLRHPGDDDSSPRRKPGPRRQIAIWIPACAGMTFGVLLAGMTSAQGARPEAAAVFLDKGLSSYQSANFKDSVSEFTKAIAIAPDWKTPVAFRAMARWTAGDTAGAKEDATVGLTISGDDAESLTARCLSHYVLKEMDKAEQDCIAATRQDHSYALGYFGLGSIFSSIGQPEASLAPITKCLQLQPQSALCFVVRGTVQDKLKRFDKAAYDYTQVLENAPTFVWAHLFRAKDDLELKKYAEAETDLSDFLKMNTDNADALYLRGNARYLQGNYAEAVNDLDRVIELDPSRGLAYSNRGLARAKLGNLSGALQDRDKAYELLPEKRAQIEAAYSKISASAPAAH